MSVLVEPCAGFLADRSAPGPSMSKVAQRYDAIWRVIAAAYKVDEVKDIRDKALALATADYDEPKKSAG